MKFSAAMLKGYALAGERKAIGSRQNASGAVCALGAASLGFGLSANSYGRAEDRAMYAFREAYDVEIAFASNGDYCEARGIRIDPDKLPGLPIDVIAGMLDAIGY